MGDRRPTQFLCHLRALAVPSVPSKVLRILWTNRLPPNVQAIIATQAQVALDVVAQLADKIAEVTPPPRVAGVSSTSDISIITARIDELARQLAALSSRTSRPRSPSQARRHARPLSRSAGRSLAADIGCYHRCFKARAKRCTASCTWQQEKWTAVASGGEQLQQLSQPPLCDGSAHEDEFLG
jgi:hypothetical protein